MKDQLEKTIFLKVIDHKENRFLMKSTQQKCFNIIIGSCTYNWRAFFFKWVNICFTKIQYKIFHDKSMWGGFLWLLVLMVKNIFYITSKLNFSPSQNCHLGKWLPFSRCGNIKAWADFKLIIIQATFFYNLSLFAILFVFSFGFLQYCSKYAIHLFHTLCDSLQ